MAISNITTEDGNILVMENVAGITGASSLSDTKVQTINVELFDTNPTLRGWIIGTQWQYDSVNKNIKAI